MNAQNKPNLTVIALVALGVIALIGFWILNSIRGAVNSRAEELVLVGRYPDMTTAIGPAVIEVIVVPVASVAIVVTVVVALIAWIGKSISRASSQL